MKARSKAAVEPRGSVRDLAYSHIQNQIAGRVLIGGMAVSELALARELGISRTPIREAIAQLASEGFLEVTPNRGAVVVRPTRADIVELYELREALEVFAAGKAAAQSLNASEVQRLQALAVEALPLRNQLRKAESRLNSEAMTRFTAMDLNFHSSLMRTAGNTRISKVVNETRLLIRIFALRHRGHTRHDLERICDEHRAIAGAVAGGERERAMQLVSAHIQSSREERLNEFDAWEHENALRENERSIALFQPVS